MATTSSEDDASGDALSYRPPTLLKGCKPNVCMVSDFFYPGLGGVEMHIYQLAICLIARGYKVVVVTHSRGDRVGIRYMPGGLKVYYYPWPVMYEQCVWPNFCFSAPVFREIWIRENIHIVHGHQATSSLTQECLLHARALGYHVVFTDHSLFGFGDAGSIHINKVLKFFLTEVDHCIAVSHTNKENLVLRAALPPQLVSVIPNALDGTLFSPADDCPKGNLPRPEVVNICVVSRLTYRKGVDLLIECIPIIAARCPNTKFIIGGDGPKRVPLEEMSERCELQDRIEFLGAIPHAKVRDCLRRGHIFLNASLTEAFCIAIVEAACTGLLVVSTSVGGVPEVLPPHLVTLSPATGPALAEACIAAVQRVCAGELNPWAIHEEVAGMYTWHDVARRTEKVYCHILAKPPPTIAQCMRRLSRANSWTARMWAVVWIAELLYITVWCWLRPFEQIDVVPTISSQDYKQWLTGLEKRKAKRMSPRHQ